MTIIVDANSAYELSNKTANGAPVLRWLLVGGGGLVVGGKLVGELAKAGLSRIMVELDRAGRLKKLDDKSVEDESQRLQDSRMCCSNDQHVIAVARISGCRLIFSKDKNLCKDAKNLRILNPAASIYKTHKHAHLLRNCRR